MDRRSFLKTSALGGTAAAATTLAAPAIAQGNITWRMVTTWPKNFPGLGIGAQRLADRITAATDGALTVQLFAAGEMVPPLQALDAVIDQTAEMSHGAAYYWQNKSVALSFFTGVPFGMTSRELTAWVRHMGGQEIWDDIYDQFGLQGFLSGDTGTQTGGWFRNELAGVEDIQGLRFRTPGLGGQVWQKIGASVTNMAAGEIFAALQSGALDAAEFVGPYNDLALGFHQVCKHYYAANDPRALQTLVNDHGVTLHSSFPDSILEGAAKAAAEIITELRDSSDPLVKRTTESFIEALNIVRQKTEGTDAGYVAAREKYFKI